MNPIFITGIDTGIGKTIISAVLCQHFGWDYWKPIQCGDLDSSDTQLIDRLVNKANHTYPEQFRLKTPASPHYASKLENIALEWSNFTLPKTHNLIIEGAGGIMVPINEKHTFLDFILHLDLEVVLVSKNYLGSINHTLLSIEVLKKAGVKLKGIIFNGEENKSSEDIIVQHSGVKVLLNVPNFPLLSKNAFEKSVEQLNFNSWT